MVGAYETHGATTAAGAIRTAWRPPTRWAFAPILVLPLALSTARAALGWPIATLAPVEVFVGGFGELCGVAVDPEANIFVADCATGAVTRIAQDRTLTTMATGLQRPVGLAFDASGLLLIAEEKAGRVLRLEANGRRTPMIANVKQPRWLAARDDGTIFVCVRRATRDTDPEPDDEPEMILARSPAGQLTIFADGFRQLQGMALNHTILFVAAQGRRADRQPAGTVFQIPILPDGSAGPPVAFGPTDEVKKPVALVLDHLGALYLTAGETDLEEDSARHTIDKVHPDAHRTVFAANLERPQGLAFDRSGNLYAADGGRVLRFLAPRAPAITTPPFTRLSPLSVIGTADPKADVGLFLNESSAPITVSSDGTGAFSAQVTLTLNNSNRLEVFATDHAGDGLTSPPARATIVHDNVAPWLGFQAPAAGSYVRFGVSVQARASDGGSSVNTFALTLDGQSLSSTVTPTLPASSTTLRTTWLTTIVPDGFHTLAAVATDRAGNTTVATRVVIVDNTPPHAQIVAGPSGQVTVTTATFSFTATDNLTPVGDLQFAWRLDSGAWSEFSLGTAATFTTLAPGPHTFEVKARDLAGNEDPTPAQRSFSVATGVQVKITAPGDGATVPAGLLLVQGTVNTGGHSAAVTVNGIVAAVQGSIFAVQVPVTVDTTVLTATVTGSSGATTSHSVAVSVFTSPNLVPVFKPIPVGGVAPLTVQFTLGGITATHVMLDVDGDGLIDFIGTGLQGERFTYTQPGLYFPVATVSDAHGAQFAVTTVVLAEPPAAVNTRFQNLWSGFKARLGAGDIPGGLAYLSPTIQSQFGQVFQTLGSSLGTIAASLEDLVVVEQLNDLAEAAIVRREGDTSFLYFIYFRRDSLGRWLIEEM
jgi:sugar lactone lactonase YvrE